MTDAHSPEDVAQIYRSAAQQNLPIFVLGGGSNSIAHDDGYDGIVLHNRIMGFEILEDTSGYTVIKVGAGEDWDGLVKRTVDMHLQGIEALSAIPGTVGAAPVQNIGAYGQEVGNVVVSVDAYDSQSNAMVVLSAADCGFSYRHSIFRGDAQGRYCITAVTMQLSKNAPQPPFYEAVERYFADHSISLYTLDAVREAVMAIRADKLPDPALQPNSGSFFKNPIIDGWLFDELIEQYPDMPHYEMPDDAQKIPAGWLIEQAGFKGKLLNGIRVNPKNALVLINESATSYADLETAKETIRAKVRDTFRILLEQEPLEITR